MNASSLIARPPKRASTLSWARGASLCALLLRGACVTAAEHRPSTNDLWDISQGVTIATNSPVRVGFDARDTFGGTFSSGEPGDTIFSDSMPDGYVHFIEWQTPQPVALGSFVLFAVGDGPANSNQREFSQFILRAKSPGASDFDLVLYAYVPTHPYTFADEANLALIAANIAPVNAQAFRAEFIQYTSGRGYDGPRIIELDGYAPDCAVPAPGLVAWWRGESNALDTAGPYAGTLQGETGFAPGRTGSGFVFDGVNDAVQIPFAASLDLTHCSVEAWVKPLSQVTDPANQALIFGQEAGRAQLVVRPGTTGLQPVFLFAENLTASPAAVSTNEIAINEFSHLAGTWDGATLRVYVNGVLSGETATTQTPAASTCPFSIGGFSDACGSTGQFFNGIVDEVGLYNRAVSATEIRTIYDAGDAGKCPPPLPMSPEIVLHPASQRVPRGSEVTFRVTSMGTPPLFYQWYFAANSVTNALPDATNMVFTLTNVTGEAAGDYSVVVSNALGVAMSAVAQLTLTFPPVITVQPQSQTVVIGSRVVFSVTAESAGPLAYRWLRNGMSVGGGTGQLLILNNVQTTQAGTYTVRVSNADGFVISSPAVLKVGTAQLGLGMTSEGPRLDVVSQTNVTYLIQVSSDLVNWTTLATEVTSPANWFFVDPTTAGVDRRFYRLRRSP